MGAPRGNKNAAGPHGSYVKGRTKKSQLLRSRRMKARKAYDKAHPKGTLHARRK